MSQIHQTYEIKGSLEAVWGALTDAKEIENWGGGPAKMNERIGADFSLWGGDIFGKNIDVRPMQLLIQNWYGDKKWEKPSAVQFKLVPKGDVTVVELDHDGIPEKDVSSFASGWKDFYMAPLKRYVESKRA